jgi:formiminotetrahydrofolate cyclodeaminase
MTDVVEPLAEASVGAWLERLARPAPDPGGGAAAALVIAAGAALVSMAAGYADEGPERASAEDAAAAARRRALAAADEDAAHSAGLAEAFHLPEDDPARSRLLRERMLTAATSSRDVAEIPRALITPLDTVADVIPPLLSADVAVAARLLAAAVRASAANLRSNTSAARSAGADDSEVAPLREAEAAALDLAERFDRTASAATDRL